MKSIIVYKDEQGYKTRIQQCSFIQTKLQEIYDNMSKMIKGVTLEQLMSMIDGEDLLDCVVNQQIGDYKPLPKALRDICVESAAKAVDLIREKAKKLNEANYNLSTGCVDLNRFDLNDNGKLTLQPEYLQEIEKNYCVCIDNNEKKLVYDKCQAVIKAISDLNATLRSGNPYRERDQSEISARISLELNGVSESSIRSLVYLNKNGDPQLNGFYFSFLK